MESNYCLYQSYNNNQFKARALQQNLGKGGRNQKSKTRNFVKECGQKNTLNDEIMNEIREYKIMTKNKKNIFDIYKEKNKNC